MGRKEPPISPSRLDPLTEALHAATEPPLRSINGILDAARRAMEADALALVGWLESEPALLGRVASGNDTEMGEANVHWLQRILTRTSKQPRRVDEYARELAGCLRLGKGHARAAPARPDEGAIVVARWQQDPWPPDLFGTAALTIGLVHGLLKARRSECQREVEGRLENWARWIHDGAAQSVVAAVIQLENLRDTLARDPENADIVIQAIQADLRRSSAELRGLVSRLAGQRLVVGGRDRSMIREVDETARRWNLSVNTTIDGDVTCVPSPTEEAAADVVREALTNAGKHAEANDVTVRFTVSPDRLLVVVSDDGRGFCPERDRRDTHLGLVFVTRRVAQVQGTAHVASRPGEGTELTASFPLDSDPKQPAQRPET